MTRQSVRVFGGPLDGGLYELDGDLGSLINLNTAAGVCTYQFATSGQDEQVILNYIGRVTDDGGSHPRRRSNASRKDKR